MAIIMVVVGLVVLAVIGIVIVLALMMGVVQKIDE
jgi:hypothetical protein